MVLKLFTTFIVVPAILASPKHPGGIIPVLIEFTELDLSRVDTACMVFDIAINTSVIVFDKHLRLRLKLIKPD